MCAPMLLLGVLVQSYIMGCFIEILNDFRYFDTEINEYDKLSRFFSTLNRYNYYKPINLKFKEKVENYFKYKWENDKNITRYYSNFVKL